MVEDVLGLGVCGAGIQRGAAAGVSVRAGADGPSLVSGLPQDGNLGQTD